MGSNKRRAKTKALHSWDGHPWSSNGLAHGSTQVAQSSLAGGIGKKNIALGIQVNPVNAYQRELDLTLYRGPIFDKATELKPLLLELCRHGRCPYQRIIARVKIASFT